jgi:hypothetical protein
MHDEYPGALEDPLHLGFENRGVGVDEAMDPIVFHQLVYVNCALADCDGHAFTPSGFRASVL